MFSPFSRAAAIAALGRFATLPVVMSLIVTASTAQAVTIMVPSFEFPEGHSAKSGAFAEWDLPASAARGFRLSHHAGSHRSENATPYTAQSAYLGNGKIPHFMDHPAGSSTPNLPLIAGNPHHGSLMPVHPVPNLPGSTADIGHSASVSVAASSPDSQSTVLGGNPHSAQVLDPSLAFGGQQVNFGDASIAAAPLEAAALPEPATGLIWALGIATTAFIAARKRNAIATRS